MGQLYIPDESWLICSDGMTTKQLKVTSQSSVKIAGGKLAATIKDRTGSNFVCGKMLIAGAILGAAIASIVVITGGLGFIAAVSVTVGGIIAGGAIGTLISIIPCFCALFTMPYNWIGCHPNVFFERKPALLENATLACLLGGKVEIHIFKEFANHRLSEIRKNIFIEAFLQSLKVAIFMNFPKTFIFGNVAVDVALHFYTGPLADKLRTFKFALDNPGDALKISEYERGSLNISTNSSRFQSSLSYAGDGNNPVSDWDGDQTKLLQYEVDYEVGEGNDPMEGTQSNAFRHALWQAEITEELGYGSAVGAGNAHENNPNIKYNESGYATMNEADTYVDLRNNEIGRAIGLQNPDIPQNVLADKVLDYYYEYGLWEVVRTQDGRFLPVQVRLPEEQYNELKLAIANMN